MLSFLTYLHSVLHLLACDIAIHSACPSSPPLKMTTVRGWTVVGIKRMMAHSVSRRSAMLSRKEMVIIEVAFQSTGSVPVEVEVGGLVVPTQHW